MSALCLPPIRLIALDGGPDLVVDRALLLVGRDPHCDVLIDSPRVSRLHCVLSRHRDAIIARDLGSTNGTYVNEQRVDRARLNSGDRIAAGQSIFRVRVETAASRKASEAEMYFISQNSRPRCVTTTVRPNGTTLIHEASRASQNARNTIARRTRKPNMATTASMMRPTVT